MAHFPPGSAIRIKTAPGSCWSRPRAPSMNNCRRQADAGDHRGSGKTTGNLRGIRLVLVVRNLQSRCHGQPVRPALSHAPRHTVPVARPRATRIPGGVVYARRRRAAAWRRHATRTAGMICRSRPDHRIAPACVLNPYPPPQSRSSTVAARASCCTPPRYRVRGKTEHWGRCPALHGLPRGMRFECLADAAARAHARRPLAVSVPVGSCRQPAPHQSSSQLERGAGCRTPPDYLLPMAPRARRCSRRRAGFSGARR